VAGGSPARTALALLHRACKVRTVGTGTSPNFQSVVILWWGVFGSTWIVLTVLAVVPRPATLEQPELLPLLALVAVSTCAIGVMMPARLFKAGVKAQGVRLVETTDPDQPQGFGQTIKVAAEPERAARMLVPLYATRTILGSALGEAVALCGFVLGFLGAPLLWCLPFFVGGWLVMGYHYPKKAVMLADASDVLGARL
jgi:hypothetical protein